MRRQLRIVTASSATNWCVYIYIYIIHLSIYIYICTHAHTHAHASGLQWLYLVHWAVRCLAGMVTAGFATNWCVYLYIIYIYTHLYIHTHRTHTAVQWLQYLVQYLLQYLVHFTATRLVRIDMGWLRLVGSLKLHVSFAKEPYKRDYILQKRRIISRSLLVVASCPIAGWLVWKLYVSFAKEPYKRDYVLIYIYELTCVNGQQELIWVATIRWLRLVGSLKLYVSFAEYSLFYRALLIHVCMHTHG